MNSSYVVGIDVGGQTTKIGVVDARGTVLAQTVIRTDTYTDITPYIGELAAALNKIIAEAGVEGKVKGIGVGAPNGNYYTGTIENAVNLSWGGTKTIEFAKLLSEAMNGLPVALTNDANAAAMGEMTYGAAKGMKNFRLPRQNISLLQSVTHTLRKFFMHQLNLFHNPVRLIKNYCRAVHIKIINK